MPNLIPREATLHTNASATANGALVNVDGMGAVGLQVANVGGTFTITCEATIDGIEPWPSVPVLTKTNNTVTAGGTITAAGLYLVDVSGAHQFRARISAASGCSVTVKAVVYEGTVAFLDTDATLDDLEAHAGTIDTNVGTIATAVAAWGVNDVSTTVSSVTYVMKERGNGEWWMMKIDTTLGTAIGHASVLNNPTLTSATLAWAARATTAVFSDYSGAF